MIPKYTQNFFSLNMLKKSYKDSKNVREKLRLGCHAKAFRLIICFFPNLCDYSFKRFLCYSVLSSTQELLAFLTISPWEVLGSSNVITMVKYGYPNLKGDLFICVTRIGLSFGDKSP